MRQREQHKKGIWIWFLALICLLALIAASAWYFFRRDVQGVKSKVANPPAVNQYNLA